MDVSKHPLGVVFDQTQRLHAPLFQRPYVWDEEKNWQPLWESIRELADANVSGFVRRPHFLGAIVLNQLTNATCQLPLREIIDGQQRLTSLQLALAAARDLCVERGIGNYANAFDKLTHNYSPLSDDPNEQFKVWPTNADREEFRTVMMAKSVSAVKSVQRPDSLMAKCYLFFYAAFGGWLTNGGTISGLHKALDRDLMFVIIDLGTEDDAQEIFQTMNALGTPLLPADLIKNFLFRRAELEEAPIAKLYSETWAVFDSAKSYWRQQIGIGHVSRPRIDAFLHHYLILMLAKDVNAGNLFSEFKGLTKQPPARTGEEHIKSIRDYAAVYHRFEQFSKLLPEGLFFSRLEGLETTTFHPLLLEVFRRYTDETGQAARRQICEHIESYLVRRMVCELSTRSYNQVVARLIKQLKESNDFSPEAIRDFLLAETADASRWPDDEQFRQAWMSLSFYKKLKRARVRMILEALELVLQHAKSEKLQLCGQLTIEHLLPQNWREYWPIPMSDPSAQVQHSPEQIRELEARRDTTLHRIGNLTLLTAALNPAISNGPWEAKRTEINKWAKLNLSLEAVTKTKWDEEEIDSRSAVLFGCAKEIWKRPAVKAAAAAM
jgi:hypothetical protein